MSSGPLQPVPAEPHHCCQRGSTPHERPAIGRSAEDMRWRRSRDTNPLPRHEHRAPRQENPAAAQPASPHAAKHMHEKNGRINNETAMCSSSSCALVKSSCQVVCAPEQTCSCVCECVCECVCVYVCVNVYVYVYIHLTVRRAASVCVDGSVTKIAARWCSGFLQEPKKWKNE